MIKKKTTEDLRHKNIEFEMQNVNYKVIRFYLTKMSVDAIVVDDEEKKGIINIPFAHLPKRTKKLIKPN